MPSERRPLAACILVASIPAALAGAAVWSLLEVSQLSNLIYGLEPGEAELGLPVAVALSAWGILAICWGLVSTANE